MKTRFNSFDIVCGVTELQKLVGLRVNQIYDIDNKTFLIRLQQHETKCVLLLESGIRFHTTAFEWPKNMAPSGFSMKLRKHLKNKRLEKLTQLGVDRIVDFQFGMNEAAYHIILELYDRGNIILTDHELNILYILRPHYEGEEVRFAVREKYPTNRAREASEVLTEDKVRELLATAKAGENLRKVLFPYLDCGPPIIEHVLTKNSLIDCVFKGNTEEIEEAEKPDQKKGGRKQKKKEAGSGNTRPFDMDADLPKLMQAIQDSYDILAEGRINSPKGYLVQKKEAKPTEAGEPEEFLYQNLEYHPYKFLQFNGRPYTEHDSFMFAVDEFYSTLEGQKIDMKTLHQEREALKKLSNVKKDHAKRLEELTKVQEVDKQRAELITRNQALVDNAILAIRSAIANQMSWPDIHELVKAAQKNGDPVASTIKQLKLEINHISLLLADPYRVQPLDDDEEDDEEDEDDYIPTMAVDVDLALSAWANARKYYDQKRNAAKKEQKTIDASQKALKSAERKTQQTLKDVRTISTISKARKVYWFEKFYWFISSENYLVIGGRDAQQNELIVKRYMRPTDIYVHAEIQGASSVVIRNPTEGEVPPKTLLEAGTMAISYSVAWDAKVVTNAYWVKSDQVSKTAPSGEYLGTGSFMIRGKKNFLPPCHLILGLSLLYKLEDSFIEKHRGERRVRTFDDEGVAADKLKEMTIENEQLEPVTEDVEIELEASDNEDSKKNEEEEKHSAENTDNEDDNGITFPDTEVKIEHDTGKVIIRHDSRVEPTPTTAIEIIKASSKEDEDDKPYIIPAVAPRKKQQQNAKKRKEEKQNQQQQKQQQQQVNNQKEDNQSNQMKRGQRGKLKKIKSKYRDQDDEERQLRMNILKSAGKDKAKVDSNKIEEDTNKLNKMKRQFEPRQPNNIDGDEDTEDVTVSADVDMLDSLTGNPFEEDELLFAIPVVAPYQALHNYKYKVKLTPGTGKRGRAAKTAILMFSKDKVCTIREKDLLKGIKEEQLARNMPGKVKLSAPQLQKFKK
ncbi:ribosome quality control complex subunit NEMF homolog [Episyrphus balteatus]|uniref:ribosome quality control complex subunit NEMF homolog n=1 Tax=Episyrphus balteatus TaxID=286459 RepID=UPI002485DE7F|nr:ribosome quality control complex subunit NEMF homolog [Episyrphus balteatus]